MKNLISQTSELYYANYYSGLDPYNLYFTCYLDSSNKDIRDTYRRFQLRKLKLEKSAENLIRARSEVGCLNPDRIV